MSHSSLIIPALLVVGGFIALYAIVTAYSAVSGCAHASPPPSPKKGGRPMAAKKPAKLIIKKKKK